MSPHRAAARVAPADDDVNVAHAPIGVYDSGVGGVSVLRALRRALPQARFVYVADSAHAPYGDRDADFVLERARHVVDTLVHGHRCRAVVLACNTASVAAAAALRAAHGVPIVAMEPAIKPAVAATRSGVVLVLATTGTVRSDAVARLVAHHAGAVRVLLQPCPGLVEFVERGELDGPAVRDRLETLLRPGLDAGADTLVLGCTHYPFLEPALRAVAGPTVTIVEPSAAIARRLASLLPGVADVAVAGCTFHTTGDVGALRRFLERTGEPHGDVRPLN